MNKSVYSLVLSDSVVEAIDELAYKMNTSRSNLINQILAERVAFKTPEMKMRDIFQGLTGRIESGFQLMEQPSDSMVSYRSALKYKYKPTIKYGVELFRGNEKTVGELRVTFRTQSPTFIADLMGFFKLWAALENKYIVQYFPDGISYTVSDGKFTRVFTLPKGYEKLSNEQLGTAIAEYINMFDGIIKLYFANLGDNPEDACENAYRKRISGGMAVI